MQSLRPYHDARKPPTVRASFAVGMAQDAFGCRYPVEGSDGFRYRRLTWQFAGDVSGKVVHREAVLRVLGDRRGES